MQITIKTDFQAVQNALQQAPRQVPYAAAVALNKTAERARSAVQADMRRLFDRPTPWVLNSLRLKRANKATLAAELAFKDINSVTSAKTMVAPHIYGGGRAFKAMEGRLMAAGILPRGWQVVPGQSARLDAYGNMSRGQISQLLNVLGTYREAGYNKANARTVARLAAGNAKKGIYGFTYWVNPVGAPTGRGRHLPPGVYQRVQTGFGTSLKPVLIFVQGTRYRRVLAWDTTIAQTAERHFPGAFTEAFAQALRTARYAQQGSLL